MQNPTAIHKLPRKQFKSVFEPGDLDQMREKNSHPTTTPDTTAPDGNNEETSRQTQSRRCSTASSSHHHLVRRRSSFNTMQDVGQDHSLTPKERFGIRKMLLQNVLCGRKNRDDADDDDEAAVSDSEDEDMDGSFTHKLRNFFRKEEEDPYAATYKREDDKRWITSREVGLLFVLGAPLANSS